MKRWTVLWILVPVLGLGLANLVSERAGAEPAPAGGNQAPVAGKDAYGDPLPQGALARLGTIRFRHPNGLCALAISPDGKTLAVAKYDSGPVRLWEFATGKEITQLPARVRQQRNISFSPDGKLLLTVEPEMLRVWDISSGKVVFQMDFGRPPASSDHTAIFAPDGKSLLTAGRDWEVRLWDMATGKQTGKIEEGRGEVSSLRFLPDGKQLAITRYTGSKPAGGMTYLCAWPGGELVRELRLPQGVNAIALSPDGKTLALGGRTFASGRHDSTIRLWDPATDKELKQLPGDNKLVTYVVFTPEGNTLLCFLDDGTVRFWDVPTGKELRTIKVSDRNGYFIPALSADGKVLVTGRGEGLVQMWDIATGEELNARPTVGSAYSPSPGGNAFGVAADGKTLITKGATLEQWDLATGKHLKRLPTPPESFYVALSPDGRLLAQYEFKKDDKIRLRDTTTGRDLPGWDPSFTGSTLAFSADGTALAALKGSLEVCVWEVSTGKELTQVSVLDKQRSGRHGNFLALSEDGRKVAVAIGGEYDEPPMARQNGTVWVWEVASGKVLRRFFGDPETSR
jgi:WD40 repeat protein